MLLNPKTWRI